MVLGMNLSWCSDPATPDGGSEDALMAARDGSGPLVLVDGRSTVTAFGDTGCGHGVPWYAERLAAHLYDQASEGSQRLVQALSAAIAGVAAEHPGCDLENPETPSAAVAVVRPAGQADSWEYLVVGGVHVIFGDRAARTLQVATDRSRLRCVGAVPAAAGRSVVGTVAGVRHLALLSSGAMWLIECGAVDGWQDALDLLTARGPKKWVQRVRQAETSSPERAHRPEDVTVVYCN
jgi:hypothetical protein